MKFAFSPLPSPRTKNEHLLNMVKKINKNGLPAYLPENFNADKVLDEMKVNRARRDNLKGCYYYILDVLHHMSQSREWKDFFDENGGYPLNTTILNNIVGNNYKEAIEHLEKCAVIIRTKDQVFKERSRLYSLTAEYSCSRAKVREIPKTTSLGKRLLKENLKYEKKNDAELKKISYITQWFVPGRISVDEKTVHGFIEFYRAEMLDKIPKELKSSRTVEEIESRINNRVNSMLDTMESLRSGEMKLTKTGKDHRLHSLLSNTKKELRTLYMYDGKPLVSVDLKASQPYLLTYLLNPKNWEKEVRALMPELYPQLSGIRNKKQLSSILNLSLFSKTQYSKGLHGNSFSEVSWNEDFYNLLVKKAQEEGEANLFPDRNTVKEKMMMILYDDGWYKDNAPDFELFSKWYPREAELIKFFKELSRKAKKSLKDKGIKNKRDFDKITNFLPILLQRLESKLMLEKVCPAIANELPNAPLLTVHDCILTTAEYTDGVRLIMERELTKIIGIPPGIKVEEYDQQKTMDELSLLAHEDMAEITNKKSKSKIDVKIKPPFLQETPQNGGDWLISYRYDAYSKGLYQDEKLIRLIDDTGNK